MRELRVYELLSRAGWLGYRGKMMLAASLGTLVPLLALIVVLVLWLRPDAGVASLVIGSALVASLAAAGTTLFLQDRLLQPVLLTSQALRRFVLHRELPVLPAGYGDAAGTLMADTSASLLQLERALDQLANTDLETGLPNHAQFARQLAVHLDGLDARSGSVAVCGLRMVNLGALASSLDKRQVDLFVRCLAGRLASSLPAAAGLARIDAGTFAFCLEEAQDPETVVARLRDLVAEVGANVVDDALQIVPALAAGVTLAPVDGTQPTVLLDQLRHALATASAARPLAVSFFSPAARRATRERFVLEQELRRAVDGRQLTLHFQPIVDLADRRVVSAEALVRWRHPQRGLVPPGLFIPIAEQSALIDEIGLWVLHAACAEIGVWRKAGLEVRVAVNLSARQLHDPRLVREIAGALAENGLPPRLLELELTETAAMGDMERTRAAFGELRELGVRLALDDFGAGYSSLSYLRSLPFDTLKIDREFVAGVGTHRNSRAICRALIELAGGLGIEVLGEGVETLDEVRTLHREGCELFQGFYFSRPMPAAEFVRHAADPAWPAVRLPVAA